MSRIRLAPFKLLPAALTAALVVFGSTTIASAQYYDQGPSADQSAPDQNVQTDPSNRVARLAYLTGNVEFAPAGEDDWGSADINRPLTTGDRLMTGNDGRAALELGDAAVRINDNSAFNVLDLNDTTTQVELSQGTLNLRVRTIGDGQTYEIDTPAVAFVAGEPGTYRVDVAPSGNGAMVTVFEGSGTVYGENGVSRPLQAGQSYRFNDSALDNVQVQRMPAPDDFDRFCQSRDQRYTSSVSRRYVAPEVVGYDDLDQYGDWQSTSDYGEVWYPTRVASGWAPYRDGHWAWIEPWGWTWVDNEPWGYAPFHYGRWVNVSNRWGWVPGPRTVRPVYAPALVAFVGGSGFSVSVNIGGGNPVGWFPLGPRDVYVPPYRASRHYFTNINVSNIRNVYVNKTVINNYYGSYAAGRPYAGRERYAYRNNPGAFTVVPRNVFAGARPVRPAVLRVNAKALAGATVTSIHVAPTRASLAIRPTRHPVAAPVEKAFKRTVVARHAPPPPAVPFAAREKVIAKQGGAPIPVAQLRQMRQQHAKAQPQPQRVKVVAATPRHGAPALAPNGKRPPVQAPRNGANPPHRASIHPIQAPLNPAKGSANNPPRETPLRKGELPSARFVRHPQNGTNAAEQHAAENQQRAQQARQKAEEARRNGEHAQAQAEQNRAQAASAKQKAEQTRQHADEARAQQQQQRAQAAQAQQREAQTRQRSENAHAQQAQQRAAQERQRADQQRAQKAQRQAEQARQHDQQMKAQQAQKHADQERQRADQARARQQQEQAQQHADQQRAQQEQQRAARAQQKQQQREQQAHAQQAQQAQMRAKQQEQRARQQQQQPQHAPPPPHPKEQKKKKKDHDQQDSGH